MLDALQYELSDAILDGELERCKAAVAKGADVNMASQNGDKPLTLAVRYDELEMCRFLLAAGADVDDKNPHGRTALFRACSASVCELLLDHGARLGERDSLGHTPLHYVASSGDLGACQILVERGADVFASSHSGATVLHSAMWSAGSRDGVAVDMQATCAYFVGLGLTSSIMPANPTPDYLTAFQYAVKNGYVDVVALFCDMCNEDPRQKTLRGRTMRQVANHHWKVKALLDQRSIEYAAKSGIDKMGGAPASESRARSVGMSPL